MADELDAHRIPKRQKFLSDSVLLPSPASDFAFQNPNFGIIFHWGLYSVPAFDDPNSAQGRSIQNGSEWYAQRLRVKPSDYHPTSGFRQKQNYHNSTFPGKEYIQFAHDFNPDAWNPDSWMQLCKQWGASYVILTAKHHDGYCLWPTRATNGGSSKIDLVRRFKESAKRFGLVFGVYYSWGEFASPVTKNYITKIVIPQINDLIRYQPRIWWFDGSWWFKTAAHVQAIEECCKAIRSSCPRAILNDRLGIKYKDINDLWRACRLSRLFGSISSTGNTSSAVGAHQHYRIKLGEKSATNRKALQECWSINDFIYASARSWREVFVELGTRFHGSARCNRSR
jgi:alpha-L-fucosidase